MGKKKFKKELLEDNFSDLTGEEQLQASMLGFELMLGVDISPEMSTLKDDVTEEEPDEPISLSSILGFEIEEVEEDGKSDNLESLTEEIDTTLEPVEEQQQVPDVKFKTKKEALEDLTESEDEDYNSEDSDSETEEEVTLDSAFRVIQADEETGDITIKDQWKDFKGQTFSFYNMREAIMNYENSNIYLTICGYLDFAISFISGPVLVIKQGNPKFKEFINTVKTFDRERIFVCSYTSRTDKDENGDPAIHFLVYYIDRDSKEELEIMLEKFENPESENNKIILDFMYCVYNAATNRHSNPWACIDSIDALIDDRESTDDDIDFVLDLIKEDPDTEMGESNIDLFMNEFVLPLESFIDPDDRNLLYIFTSILGSVFTFPQDENDVYIVPDNFGYNIDGKKESVDTVEETVEESSIHETIVEESDEGTTTTEVTVNAAVKVEVTHDDSDKLDDADKDIKDTLSALLDDDGAEDVEYGTDKDSDDEDEVILDETPLLSDMLKSVDKEEEIIATKKLGNVSQQTGIKKFGTKPYNGSMIIK